MDLRITLIAVAVAGTAVVGATAGFASGTGEQDSEGDPEARRLDHDRAHRGLAVVRQDERLPERVDLAAEQIMEPLYTADQGRQDAQAVARHELHEVQGRQDLHLQAASRREVLQRQADDLRRRQVLDRRRPQAGQGLGLPRRRDQEHRGAEPEHGRLHAEVPVGAVPRRHRAVLQRDHPEQLRRQDARRRSTSSRSAPARSCGTSGSSASRSRSSATRTTGRRASRISTASRGPT